MILMCENIRADGNMGKDWENVESRHIKMDPHRAPLTIFCDRVIMQKREPKLQFVVILYIRIFSNIL